MTRSILMLGAGVEQCSAIVKAQSLGLKVVACDQARGAPGLTIANQGYALDIFDTAALLKVARDHEVSGVFCHAIEAAVPVSDVAHALGLPGISPSTSRLCSNKLNRIEALSGAGIPVADFRAISGRSEAANVATEFGFPLIVKPLDSAGARGIQLVSRAEDVISAYDEALTYSASSSVLIERQLSGPQISTESIVYDGEVFTFAVADRNYQSHQDFLPYFIEDGINFPTALDPEMLDMVLATVKNTIEVLGISFGAAKGDIIIHEGKPHIIEMACRTSGGWFGAGSVALATGVDPLTPLIQMSIGDSPCLDLLVPRWNFGCAQRYWIPRKSGKLGSVNGLSTIPSMPGVAHFTSFFPEPGSFISRAENHAQRCAQVICTASTREDAIAFAESAVNAIKVEITS